MQPALKNNDSDALPEMPKLRLDAMFARQADATPDATALLHRGVAMSYRDLDARTNRMARHLTSLGVGPEIVVGVCLERSSDLIITLLGILKAGGAYLPLDPHYPSERLNFALRDSAPNLVITRAHLRSGLVCSGSWLDLDKEADAIASQSAESQAQVGTTDNLAYIIYTSGSTGEPKGVMLSHTAGAFIEWARHTFTSDQMSRVAATTSICFDPSVFEIFAPLCTGGTVVLKENLLEAFTAEELPTLLNGVPSAFKELARARSIPGSVKIINIGGETCKPTLVHELYKVTRATSIYNHYGPTEASICTTVTLVPKGEMEPAVLPIGKPIAGAQLYVLNPQMEIVGPNESGELYIGGNTLARGYLNNPGLTAEKFVPNPFGPAGQRMYRTGDLVRWSAAGELEFLGRIDQQVKLNGFRIELGEIEAAVLRLAAIQKAVAMIRLGPHGEQRLVLYVETPQNCKLSDIRRHLAMRLPDYMLPSMLVVLPAFPVTPSGKIDRNAFPPPDWKHRNSTDAYLPPIEEAIVDTFQDVLGSDVVGLDDNFFDLGGDSLLALGVLMRLEVLLGQPIPPESLFHNPTAGLLASMLKRQTSGEPSHLTALQPEGELTPIFCLPDISGRPLSYVSLARHLAPDFPVYGLSPGPLADMLIKNPSIAVLTSTYIAEIRKIQPVGPYRIAGYSSGGVAAFDLAMTMKAEGEDILLILLDASICRRLPPARYILRWARQHLSNSVSKVGWQQTARTILQSRRIWLKHPRFVGMREVPVWIPSSDRQLARSLMQAEKNYDFKPFLGPAVFVECTKRGPIRDFLNHDGWLGWHDLLKGPVTRIQAETDHFKLMREPFAAELVQRLCTFLRK